MKRIKQLLILVTALLSLGVTLYAAGQAIGLDSPTTFPVDI
ncbi:hypothetical protein [Bowmanella denitrificans]|nr:hypothetical protein [Bowmanella denitrificans]